MFGGGGELKETAVGIIVAEGGLYRLLFKRLRILPEQHILELEDPDLLYHEFKNADSH